VNDWREPHWKRGDWRLPVSQAQSWMERFGRGEKFTCMICVQGSHVSLLPHYRIAVFDCGHIMELPNRMLG
jgi:hypothetical protein